MLKILSFALAIYTLACLFLYVTQRTMMYFPTPENSLASANSFWLKTGEYQLKLWHLNPQLDDAIMYFGGNAEAVENNLYWFRQTFADKAVYLVNYRGYGGSSGKPSEQALLADALAIYDEIQQHHTSISVIGRSLGSGVASYLASKRMVKHLVLVTPYDSMTELASTHYPIFPVRWLLKDRYDSVQWASNITSKTLLLAAETDQVVPRKHSMRLLDALRQTQPELLIINGATHNTISDFDEYQHKLAEFFREYH